MRVGRVIAQPSHTTVRADPHTAVPNLIMDGSLY